MNIYVICPQCGDLVEIISIGCAIFRHGVYKHNQQQLNPHATKDVCDDAFKRELIYGCGKPFRLLHNNNIYKAIKCDYI